MTKEKSLLLLLDGHAMVYRAFYAIQTPLTVRDTGEDVRGVYGFVNAFLRILSDLEPTHCAIAFDVSGPTFRHDQYDEYKAQRPAMPVELRHQFSRIRQVMEAFDVPIFEQKGYEADDVLGTLCSQADNQGLSTVILTGDTDELQLVTSNVRVMLSHTVKNTKMYGINEVKERYGGLGPDAIPDIKALQGDVSDNIPGVPGIGSKTAIKLLQQFGTVEAILENIQEIATVRTRRSIEDNRDAMVRGKFLTTIVRNLPISLDLEKASFGGFDRAKIVDVLRELEFYSIVPRIPKSPLNEIEERQIGLDFSSQSAKIKTRIVNSPDLIKQLLFELDSTEGFAFKIVAHGQNPMSVDVVGISFCNQPESAWYIPIGHNQGVQLGLEEVLVALRPVFVNNEIPKVSHDVNFDLVILRRLNVKVKNVVFDTKVMAHAGGRQSVDLEALSLEYLNYELQSQTEITGSGRNKIDLSETLVANAAEHYGSRINAIWQIVDAIRKEISLKEISDGVNNIETPLIPVLSRMQFNGISIDVSHLSRMSVSVGKEIDILKQDIFGLVGHDFNISSSQQLGQVLFNELGLPKTKKTKTGYSTDAGSLEGLKHTIRINENDVTTLNSLHVLEKILEYRQLAKIKSTYLDSLPEQLDKTTKRIHTMYQQTGSATGRVSSNDPNVQNIPVRTELGREVRKAFITRLGSDFRLLSADYSQIELRVLAHLSGDSGLIKAFRDGQDIHSATASSVYGIPIENVDFDMRRIAKIMNFGVIYGLSPFGISQQTGLSLEDGSSFIETYFGKYPGIKQYIQDIKLKVREDGYVETLNGRRRYIPEVKSNNFYVRSAGERMAVNMPIQGTAADIIKLAMIRMQDSMDSLELNSYMTIQVHDELIFEVSDIEVSEMRSLVETVMPNVMDLYVPLDVDVKEGLNWGEMR